MLICSLEDISNIKTLQNYCEGIVVYTNDFSSFYNKAFDAEELLNIYKQKGSLKMFIDLSQMMENADILALRNFLNIFRDLDVYYLYIDLGVFQVLKELGIENRGVYNPTTLITNRYDLEFYLKQGMLSAAVSLEIPVEDIKNISEYNNHNLWIQSFGYHQMFHSKRHLISLYKEHDNLNFENSPLNSYLKEEKRDDMYHIYEGKHCTLLFRSYVIDYLSNLADINPKYIFMDNIFIDNNTFLKAVKAYSLYLNKKIDLSSALDMIKDLNLDIQDGFKYNDTVYQKEKNYA
jgi:collagenase-like PrtC family protease